jgi:hypothetical protein
MHISDQAAETLHNTLTQNDAGTDDVIRIAQTGEGLALAIGAVIPGDETFMHEDRTVLAIPSEIAPALSDATLDTVDDDGEVRLVLRK